MNDRTTALRDEIVRLLREALDEAGAPDPASVEPIDEDGVIKLVVVDEDANCYRVTVEEI